MAIDTALDVIRRAKDNGLLVIAFSLDIKAAFDNAWWPALFHGLRTINCPRNIYGLIRSYVRNRMVTLDHAGVRVTIMMTKGCIQGSACGPVLWNIILDVLLGAELSAGCHIQAYADDVFLVVAAKDIHRLESTANAALSRITDWGSSVKLVFGPSKTQMIAFTPGAKAANIIMDGHTLKFSPDIKLLGVILDEKLLFNKHIQYVISKAIKIFNKLCLYTRPTWGAHPENIRAIYQQVIVTIVTYAAGIWGHVVSKRGVRKRLEIMQRGFAIKAIKAFRTVSTATALALAKFIPIDLKIKEVYAVERTRLSCTSDFLPHDITFEKPTAPHKLLHPSERITIHYDTVHSQQEVDTIISPDSVCIYTDGSKQGDGAVGAAFVCYVPAVNSPITIVKKFNCTTHARYSRLSCLLFIRLATGHSTIITRKLSYSLIHFLLSKPYKIEAIHTLLL
ncbi:unnamed protein product [Parnassius mnemosyne]|uniref:Reverse transcriptase domain-containing protein n=1 Tax=Parnassius mnemosyne TaxID=213953 RepID=A0AAV1KZZ8_9NEOP